MARYLVTGGCGFIGSHLADRLVAAGHHVHILDNLSTGQTEHLPRGATLAIGNVADSATVAGAMTGADGCFHLAAVASTQRSNEAWLATHQTNVGGTVAVLEAARQRRVPVVYASSAAIYGDQGASPIEEGALPYPATAYGIDKLGSELHARVAGLIHAIPTMGFRFFNVYGPRQDPGSPYSGVISIFVDRMLESATLGIHGDGRQVRDFVYVGDVVRFLVAGMERATTEARVLNVCTGRATSILTLAETIAGLCGASARLRFLPARPGDIRRSVGSPALAETHLGVRAQVGLVDGLHATLGWRLAGSQPGHLQPTRGAA